MRIASAIALSCLLLGAAQVQAAEPTCAAAATEKKLSGAAKTSYLKKIPASNSSI